MARLPQTIAAFAGNWALDRQIEDRRNDQRGRLSGTVQFSADDHGLIYREQGELSFPGQPPLTASQTYLWRDKSEGGAIVLFADGRAFHTIQFDRTMPEADHFCDPDFYHVTYDFTRWPDWSTVWRVQGPRKDYRMQSHFTRGDA